MKSSQTTGVALGVLGLAAFCLPLFLVKGKHLDTLKALPAQDVRRGPYMNAGSKDIGPDTAGQSR
jgi:hypothetical protein